MTDRERKSVLAVRAGMMLLAACSLCRGQQSEDVVGGGAEGIMESVRAGLPRANMRIDAVLSIVRRKGLVGQSANVEAELRFGRNQASATYTVRDAFGSCLEQMNIVQTAGRMPALVYRKGDPLESLPAPDPGSSIQGTDISWLDLSLSYLWWTNAVVIGNDVVRGQACMVVQAWAPEMGADAVGGYGWVCLWVADNVNAVLKADGYSRDGTLLRRMEVRSVRKVGEQWMVKDLEVTGQDKSRRTRIKVNDVAEIRDTDEK